MLTVTVYWQPRRIADVLCAELDVSFPTTYSLNLIENGVKIVTLDEAFKDIHMIAKRLSAEFNQVLNSNKHHY